MDNNYLSVNYGQNISFNGKLTRKSAKLAKNIGENVYEALNGKAQKMHKDTIVTLSNPAKGGYAITAYNPKFFGQYSFKCAGLKELVGKIQSLNPRTVDEIIIGNAIKSLKKTVTYPLFSTVEKRMIKHDAKAILKVERDLGMKETFWSDVKKLMAQSEEKERNRILEEDQAFLQLKALRKSTKSYVI